MIDNVTEEDLVSVFEKRPPKVKVEPSPEPPLFYANVLYGEWIGPRKRMKLEEHEAQAIIKGKWAYLLPCGKRKRVSGKHFHIISEYQRKPRDFDKNVVARIKKNTLS